LIIEQWIEEQREVFALKESTFQKRVEKGKRAEKEIYSYFIGSGVRFFRFEHPGELTDKPLPIEIKRILEQAGYLRFDAICRNPDGTVFMTDLKFKAKAPPFYVNKNDYREYWKVTFILPFFVYFYVESEDKIYRHEVTSYKNFKTLPMPDGNRVYEIPEELVKPVER